MRLTLSHLYVDVGALQSRFEFASSNLASSIQNSSPLGQISWMWMLLNPLIFFSGKIAGIYFCIAQANQLPQNLLNLLGNRV